VMSQYQVLAATRLSHSGPHFSSLVLMVPHPLFKGEVTEVDGGRTAQVAQQLGFKCRTT
jgi:hypothetical protein